MKILDPLFIQVIQQLIKSGVDFILIGGYAVNFYGYGRYTGDMDFWLDPTNSNKLKFIDALTALKKNADDIKEISELDFTEAQVISIGEEPLRIDFLTKVNMVKFDEAIQNKNILQLKDFQVPVVNYDHLIQTKITTGRAKDKADIEELQKINRDKK